MENQTQPKRRFRLILLLLVGILLGVAGTFWFLNRPHSGHLTPRGGPNLRKVLPQSFVSNQLLNLNQLLQSARVVPYMDPARPKDKQFVGFLVARIEPDSPLLELGLKEQDIIMQVEDVELTNAAQGLVAFQRLRGLSDVNLMLQRDGKDFWIHYEIR